MPGHNAPPPWLAPWIFAPVGALFLGFGVFVLLMAFGVVGEGALPLGVRVIWLCLGAFLAAIGAVVLINVFKRR